MIFRAWALLLIPTMAAAAPTWVKDGSRLSGSTYVVTCSGDGPAVDLARKAALAGCQASASSQLQHTIAVKSVSVETESDVGFHQEVTENATYTNLTCTPEKEEVEDRGSGFRVWLQCRFDLTKAAPAAPDVSESKVAVIQPPSTSRPKLKLTPTVFHSEERRVVSLSTIPKCDSVLVKGVSARVERCDRNPLAIVVQPGDQSVIVRAYGYQPKTFLLKQEGRNYESVTVVLERN